MNTKGKIYFIIGASGSEKTTIVKALENNYLNTYKIVYFDSTGVPSFKRSDRNIAKRHPKPKGKKSQKEEGNLSMTHKLAGKIALINGAAQGIGKGRLIG